MCFFMCLILPLINRHSQLFSFSLQGDKYFVEVLVVLCCMWMVVWSVIRKKCKRNLFSDRLFDSKVIRQLSSLNVLLCRQIVLHLSWVRADGLTDVQCELCLALGFTYIKQWKLFTHRLLYDVVAFVVSSCWWVDRRSMWTMSCIGIHLYQAIKAVHTNCCVCLL